MTLETNGHDKIPIRVSEPESEPEPESDPDPHPSLELELEPESGSAEDREPFLRPHSERSHPWIDERERFAHNAALTPEWATIPAFDWTQLPPIRRTDVLGRPVVHRVKMGDTFAQLAVDYGVTVDELLVENDLIPPTRLFVGQRLKIPR